MQDGHQNFARNPTAQMNLSFTDVVIHNHVGDRDGAKRTLNKIIDKHNVDEDVLSDQSKLDFAHACLAADQKEKGKKLLLDLVRDNHENDSILNQVQQVFVASGVPEAEAEAEVYKVRDSLIQINNEGVKLFESGRMEEAVEFLQNAANDLPHSQVLNRNAINALIGYMQKNGTNDDMISKTTKFMHRLASISPKDDIKLIELKKAFKRLLES